MMTIHAMIGSKSPCDKHVAVTTPVSFATGYVLVCNPRCHMKKRRNEWLRLRWNLCSEYPFFVDDALSLFSLSPNSNVVDVLYIYISLLYPIGVHYLKICIHFLVTSPAMMCWRKKCIFVCWNYFWYLDHVEYIYIYVCVCVLLSKFLKNTSLFSVFSICCYGFTEMGSWSPPSQNHPITSMLSPPLPVFVTHVDLPGIRHRVQRYTKLKGFMYLYDPEFGPSSITIHHLSHIYNVVSWVLDSL